MMRRTLIFIIISITLVALLRVESLSEYSRSDAVSSDCERGPGEAGGHDGKKGGCNARSTIDGSRRDADGLGGGKDSQAKVLVLDGVWSLRNRQNTIQLNGTVPGNMYSALQSAGIIDDPYYGFNDDNYRWVSYDNWTYSRIFDASQFTLEEASRLTCDGLDTVATVRLNGVEVGRSDNQFTQYNFDITGTIQPGLNELEIEFQSAVGYAQNRSDNHAYRIPPDCPPAEYHPECHANFIRKAQCSFSWDWGPAFPTQGIWKTIHIETFSTAMIRSVTPLPERDAQGEWWLNVTVLFDLATPSTSLVGVLTQDLPELNFLVQYPIQLDQGQTKFSYRLRVPNAKEWWPRGYGAQTLYSLYITFKPSATDASESRVVRRIGFRTVEIVEDPVEAGQNSGNTFYFKINSVPVFMKGSNFIPMDSFMDRVTYERLRALMEAAVEANMNTIRIWGGGIYESDDFYDIADELGILIWQDMMFACSMYPVDDQFLNSVRNEINYQVRRLSHHPSLVAWTANNENEGALVDNWYGTGGAMYQQYKNDYVRLYIDTVRDEILSNDWTRAFLSSSPTNGQITEDSDWISESPRPGQPQYGDVHYYNYNDDCLDYTIFPPTRYASEYGYQSWPSYQSLLKVALPDQLYRGSVFFNHREHHHGALNGTETQIRNHFQWPDSGDQLEDFKSYIFLTQAAQAVCYQSETEFYRRGRSEADKQTMGALYWQHNDIWQAPSWSTIDYEGHWKMAHYFAVRFFADPMLSIIREQSNIAVYTVSDSLSTVVDGKLFLQVWDWAGSTHLLQKSADNIVIASAGAYKVYEQDESSLLAEAGCSSPQACFVICWAEDSSGVRLTFQNVFYPVSWKDAIGMSDPQLTIDSVESVNPMTFSVTITSRSVSAFTWLTSGEIVGRFSDNGFLMTPGTLQFYFYTRHPGTTVEELRSSLTITSLWNQYSRPIHSYKQ